MTMDENQRRANLRLRLTHIARQIDAFEERLRKPHHNEEDSAQLWALCAAHQRILHDLASDVAPRFAAGTVQTYPLPKASDPLWQKPNGRDIIGALHAYLDDREPCFDEEDTAVDIPSRLRRNVERSAQLVIDDGDSDFRQEQ